MCDDLGTEFSSDIDTSNTGDFSDGLDTASDASFSDEIEDIPVIASDFTVKTASSEVFCEGLYRRACCGDSNLHD